MASRKRLTAAEANAALAGHKWFEAMRALPDDVDVNAASERMLEWVDGKLYALHRYASALPTSVLEAGLKKMNAAPTRAGRLVVLELTKAGIAWKEITAVLASLDRTYAWGSKQMKAIFRSLADRPETLAAIQTAVVGDLTARVSFLAVLAADGSDASVDALLPRFTDESSDQLLADLQKHAAKTDALDAMFRAVAQRRSVKNQRSPATAFVSALLGVPLEKVSIQATLNCVELNTNNVPRYQGNLRIDSEAGQWWSVYLSQVVPTGRGEGQTYFGVDGEKADRLKLGTCTLEELPKWVKRAEKTLGITFGVSDPYGSLRGKKREAFRDWLFGGR